MKIDFFGSDLLLQRQRCASSRPLTPSFDSDVDVPRRAIDLDLDEAIHLRRQVSRCSSDYN